MLLGLVLMNINNIISIKLVEFSLFKLMVLKFVVWVVIDWN